MSKMIICMDAITMLGAYTHFSINDVVVDESVYAPAAARTAIDWMPAALVKIDSVGIMTL